MGYYTKYSLKIIEGPYELFEEIDWLRKNSDYASTALQEGGKCGEAVTWREHQKDLKKVSKKFPLTVFELSGEGEEMPDLWIKYFKNGKMQECRAVITYEPFDESKLA